MLTILKSLFSVFVLVSLIGCNAAVEGDTSAPNTTSPAPEIDRPTTDSPANDSEAPVVAQAEGQAALEAGGYCYATETETLSGAVRLTVDDQQQVTGESRATIHSEEAGYYSSYAQKFSGNLQGEQLQLDLTTWIEYDVQEEQETWTVTPEELDTGREVFTAADCETVRDRFVNENGLEAEDLTADAVVHTNRVEFAPGETSTVLENSVVRGERDVYLLNAQGGQQMALSISSLEDNAVFDVVSPSGSILMTEGTEEDILLPETGDYQVIVGGTRGNATYSLTVEIR